MNINDFRCMRQGHHLAMLTTAQAALLAPVEYSNGKKRSALLALHGFSSSPAVFRELLKNLTGYDTVIAPVLPGHGLDLDTFAKVRRGEWLAHVDKICAKLVAEYEQVDVLGFSLGGLLACHLSYRYKLHHLFLLAPALDLHVRINKLLLLANLLHKLGFSAVRNAAGNLITKHHCEIAYRQLPLTTSMEILRLIKDFSFKVPSCPTDIFLGTHDLVVASRSVAARFANQPNCHIHWLKQTAHVLPLEDEVKEIIARINSLRQSQRDFVSI